MRVVTVFGGSGFLVPAIVVVGVVLYRRRGTWGPLGFLAAAYGGAAVAYRLIKVLVGRPRPVVGPVVATAPGYAFPSGHATQAAAVFAALVVVAVSPSWSVARRRAVGAAAAGAAFLVGVSRVYLGVHWVTDVMAGWALGISWVLALLAMVQRARRRRRVAT
jgi:undecaprenyl-diphosphatase